jgi:hypothetical protein
MTWNVRLPSARNREQTFFVARGLDVACKRKRSTGSGAFLAGPDPAMLLAHTESVVTLRVT